ncbi:hypothetical protein [Nonlabens agnitus]|uniref:Lipoprotein n=1 Tax=Nonlabens agnitus TaxID=870484 RepID=A0A2S9WV31_9FLAO|nr:hypothetical protein [Nonlabens agnitus]PRP67324.1 hypothetical protein BST86_09570 [Nonlabens agnitus]
MKNILTLFAIALVLTSCGSKKDTNKVSRDFNIEILSIYNNEVKLKCTQGCKWTELAFELNNNESLGIDAYGITDPINTLADLSDDLPDFKFTMVKTDNGLTLERIRDTGWNKLSFACYRECNKRINYEGTED